MDRDRLPTDQEREDSATAQRELEPMFQILCDVEDALRAAASAVTTEAGEGDRNALAAVTSLGIATRELTIAYEASLDFRIEAIRFQRYMAGREDAA